MSGVGEGAVLIGFIAAQRCAELVLARANARRRLAAGGVEFGATHYPVIVALHVAWVFGLWVLGVDRMIDRGLLAVFILLQAARVWTIASLGRAWTTRIVVVPGARPLCRGPYRFLRHPNYLIVAAEIAVVPLALGLPVFAVVFSMLNAAVLALRIRIEDRALAWAAAQSSVAPPLGGGMARSLANEPPGL